MQILELTAALEKVQKKSVKSTDDLAIEQLVSQNCTISCCCVISILLPLGCM
jgi:hypothetical protein